MQFDISEKIILHAGQAGINTILELDLYPEVDVQEEWQYVKIGGSLKLNGAYRCDAGLDHELSYVIPVDITLPSERADLENISFEVETFDYSIVSPFELKIEAALVIYGINSQQEAEELAVASISSEEDGLLEQETFREEYDASLEQETLQEEHGASVERESFQENHDAYRPESIQPHVDGEITLQDYSVPLGERQLQHFGLQENGADGKEEVVPFSSELSDVEYVIPKPAEESFDAGKSKWISWLVGGKEEKFTSLRMVIAQNGDSVENIAEKYDASVKQVFNINNLDGDSLEEGQVIQIPCDVKHKAI